MGQRPWLGILVYIKQLQLCFTWVLFLFFFLSALSLSITDQVSPELSCNTQARAVTLEPLCLSCFTELSHSGAILQWAILNEQILPFQLTLNWGFPLALHWWQQIGGDKLQLANYTFWVKKKNRHFLETLCVSSSKSNHRPDFDNISTLHFFV